MARAGRDLTGSHRRGNFDVKHAFLLMTSAGPKIATSINVGSVTLSKFLVSPPATIVATPHGRARAAR